MKNYIYLFVAISIAVSACTSKSDTVSPDGLTGTWVEEKNRQDTLIFNRSIPGGGQEEWLLVNRGKEVNAGGYLLPKIGSGYYSYYIKDNQLYVLNMLSSLAVYAGYPIEQRNGQLLIGNFFEIGFNKPHTAIRTFVKL